MAYLQVARCRLIWPLAIKSTSLYIARRSGKSTLRDFLPGSSGTSKPQPLEPGHNPFPSGHILQGRRINRSVPGRPAVPKRHPRATGAHPGGVDAGFPAVPAPRRFPRHPSGIGPHDYWPFKAEAARLAAGVLGSACLMLSQSQRPTHRLNRHSHLTVAHPPSQQPPGRHPCQAHTLSVLTLHVVGKAHFYQPVGPKVPGG